MQIDKYIDPELLADNAAFTVTEEVRHDFSEEEITQMKADFFTNSNYQDIRAEALQEFKGLMTSDFTSTDIIEMLEEMKGRDYGITGLKRLKKDAKSSLRIINRGYDIMPAKLWAMAYYELERMVFYNTKGNYVYDRPMKPEERQTTILSGAKMKSING